MTQFVRTFVLALTYGRLPARSKLRKLGLGVVVMSGLIASVGHAEEAKRCAEFAARLDSLEGKVQWQVSGESQWKSASLNQTFCYGDIILVQEKRAALRLSNNTLVRLNENSSIKLIPPQQSFWVELIDGAAHFLTRTPKSFTVKAPFVNAAVEGTEFLVTASNGVNQVGVIEGVVRSHNPAGSVLLTQGMSTQTGSTQQAPGAPVQLKLNDFVSWAMYFPPLPKRLNLPADIKTLLEQGRDGEVIARISKDAQASAEILSLGAALALNRGQLPQAEELVQRAFKLNPKHPDAQAIAALVDLGRGEAERGQQRAAQNVLDNPFNPTALIAHSYSQQGQGRLQGALDSALEARRLTPTDSQIIARVAELHLALGQKAAARKALDEALALAPNHSRLLTFKGFSLLAERKGKTAQTYFAKASQKDSADPYAQLGWGLSLIQQGKLESGREHLELAVILDPANSLLRSYLGKGYFEENRLKLAETQLNLAQTLDPNDPTPWYYLSQVKHDQHRYGEALQLVETSIDKNTNRAVYRAEGSIGSDAAARLADKSRIYQAMGFEGLAIGSALDAIRMDADDYSGHRAAAMTLTGKAGSQTRRANEALQSTLLAPIGSAPLAPGFSETSMVVLPGAGPHEMGLNEFNASFNPGGISGFASALMSVNNTRAYEGQVQLVGEKTDLSIGQYYYSSNGFRENNDRDYLVSEAKLKYQILEQLQVNVAAAERSDESGDLSDPILKSEINKTSRKASAKEQYNFSFNFSLAENIGIFGLKSKKNVTTEDRSEDFFPWGDSVKSEVKDVQTPDLAEIMGRIGGGYGDFYFGYNNLQQNIKKRASFTDVVEGEVQEPFFDFPKPEKSDISRYFIDYVYSGSQFFFGFGVESNKVESEIYPSNGTFLRSEIGFDCFLGVECVFVHDEFLSMPLHGRESLRPEWLDVYGGRTDYLPFAKVGLDAIGFSREWDVFSLKSSYQEVEIKSPHSLRNKNALPDFKEGEYFFGLFTSFSGVDAFHLGYRLNKSDSVYGVGLIPNIYIPNKFETEMVEMSLVERFGSVLCEVRLRSVGQEYATPVIGDEDAEFNAKVSLVNLDLSAKLKVNKDALVSVSVLNLLGNEKEYIEGFLANAADIDGAAKMDSYFTERVIALSVKVGF